MKQEISPRSLVCRPARLEPDGAAQAQAKNALLLRAGMQTARPEPDAAAQAQAKYALLLCGLIGTLRGGCASCAAGFSRKHHEPEGASARLVAYVAESHLEHVVRPNAAAGGVDVFVHTWNPEAAVFVDAQYGRHLRLSLHQAPEARGARSFALSIGRGARLIRAFERRRGAVYETALVMRFDSFVISPVQMRLVSRPAGREADGAIFLDTRCCAARTPGSAAWMKAQCVALGRAPGRALSAPCTVSMFKRVDPEQRWTPADSSFFTNDWWLSAPAAVVETWLDIAANWRAHTCWAAAYGFPRADWSHHRWMLHIHDGLNATAQLRFTNAVFVVMARLAYAHGITLGRHPGCAEPSEPTFLAGRDEYRVADFMDRAVPDEAAVALGYSRRFAPMARQCPLAELSRNRTASGEWPLFLCGSPLGNSTGPGGEGSARMANPSGVALCNVLTPAAMRAQYMSRTPDSANASWLGAGAGAALSPAHALGRKLFTSLPPFRKPAHLPLSELRFDPLVAQRCAGDPGAGAAAYK